MPEGQEGAPVKEKEVASELDYVLYTKVGNITEVTRVFEKGDALKLPPLPDKTILKVETGVGEAYYQKKHLSKLQEAYAEKNLPGSGDDDDLNPFYVERLKTKKELQKLQAEGYEVKTTDQLSKTASELPKAA